MNKTVKLMAVGALVLSLSTGGMVTANTGTPTVQNLSLNQSIDLALKQNPKIELAKIGVESAESGLKLANYSADQMSVERVQTYELGKLKWLNPRMAEMNVTLKKAEAELNTDLLKQDVERNYYEVLKAERMVEIKRATLQRTKEQLKLSEANVKAGTLAKGDLLGFQAQLAKNEAEVSSAENQLEISLLTFNKVVGNDLGAKIKLTDRFVFEKAKDLDYNKSLKDALENNIAILKVKETLAVTEKEFEVAQKFFGTGVTAYDQAVLSRKEADLKVKQQVQDTSLAVKQAYLNLAAIEKSISAYTKAVEMEKENLRIYNLKYKAGLVTSVDVSGANLSLAEAEERVAQQMYQYNLLKASIKNGIFQSSSESTPQG